MVAGSAAAGHVRLTAADATGAVSVFLLVFLSTFPVVIPFLVFGDIGRAMRVSNAIAVALLCGGGYSLGRYGGLSPWWTAGALAALGTTLVAITMPSSSLSILLITFGSSNLLARWMKL